MDRYFRASKHVSEVITLRGTSYSSLVEHQFPLRAVRLHI